MFYEKQPKEEREAYIEDEGKLRLASMSYTRINY